MNVANAKAKLFKILDCLPAGSVTPDDVVVQERAHPIFAGHRIRKPGSKMVPTVCVWGPEQDRKTDKPRMLYNPRLSAIASPRACAAAQAQAERRAKWVREQITEYNETRKANDEAIQPIQP